MKKEQFVTDKHLKMKSTLRTVGPILLLIGGVCILIAFVDFFSSVDSFENVLEVTGAISLDIYFAAS